MADARAGIHVVVAERRADHFLHHENFLVGAARRGDAADRATAIFRLDFLEARRRKANGLVPRHFFPRVGYLVTHHGLGHPVLVRGIAPGKAALHAGVALIGAAILVRHHADNFIALHFGLEGTAHAAIGASCNHRMLGLAELDHRFFRECCGGAGLHTGPAGHAFGIQEAFIHASRNMGGKAPAINGEREGALHFLASPDTARTHNALGGIKGEIGVAFVFLLEAEILHAANAAGRCMVVAVIAIAHIAQPHGTRHVLQFAVAIGGTGEAVQRMV